MKLKRYTNYKINEGMRVNPKILKLDGEYKIDEVIENLKEILNEFGEITVHVVNIFYVRLDIKDEVKKLITVMENWKSNNVTTVQGNDKEWIPIW